MTEMDKLKRDIDTLRESIRLDWQELAQLALTADERQGIRDHIEICQEDLRDLLNRLDQLKDEQDNASSEQLK